MSRSAHPALFAILFVLVLHGSQPARSSEIDTGGPLHLSGTAAWAALLGNTIAGRTPDGPYSEYYATGGEVFHADRDGTDRGRWVLRDPLVCFSFPEDDTEDCRTPELEGQHGAFIDRDGSRYPFDLLNGNPNHF